MGIKFSLVAVLGLTCLATRATGVHASVILASFDQHAFGGGAINCPGDRVQLFLEHDSQNFTHIVTLGQDLRFWQNGDNGEFDFTPNNSPTFAEFSQLVSDGQDDYIVTLGYVPYCGGGGPSYLESTMLGSNPDLAGSQLDFVRLIVHDIVVEPYVSPCCGDGVEFDAHINYEFWGTTVPEPASVAPFFLWAIIGLGVRRIR